MIRSIVFDVGYVLVDYTWKEQFRKFGYDDGGVARLARELFGAGVPDGSRALWEKYDNGEISDEEIRRECMARYPEDREAITWFFDRPSAWCAVCSDMADLIPEIRAKGYGVYLLSNYPETLWQHHVAAQPFHDWVDGETVSYAEHMGKPEPGFFLRLLDRYGLKAEECLFLDDRRDNTQAAEALGFSVITLDSPGARAEAVRILRALERLD